MSPSPVRRGWGGQSGQGGRGGFAGLWLSPLAVFGCEGREDAEFACQRGVMEALHVGVCLQGDGEIAGGGVAGADLLTKFGGGEYDVEVFEGSAAAGTGIWQFIGGAEVFAAGRAFDGRIVVHVAWALRSEVRVDRGSSGAVRTS